MGESTKDTFPDSFELLIQRCIAELEAQGPPPRRPFIARVAGRCITFGVALAHFSELYPH